MAHKKPADSSREHRSPVTIATEVLKRESSAILDLIPILDDAISQAVALIVELVKGKQGRLIVIGMGKAGFIAQKISATFASVGVASFFLHPAEATHGDLGRFVKNDLALIFSNSGETPELLRIVPHIKRFGYSIISVTSLAESSLASHSDVVLRLGAIPEADPLGLAPTTSTTAMLALGDALALAVVEHLGLSREQFALYHPGGSLGRKLLTVGEIMRTGTANCIVPEELSTRDVIHKIATTDGRPGAAAIVSTDGNLAGIFTDGDLRRLLDEQPADFLNRPIRELMSRKPKTVVAEQLATEALNVLKEFRIDQLIVVDSKNKPIGLVDIQDLIDFRDLT